MHNCPSAQSLLRESGSVTFPDEQLLVGLVVKEVTLGEQEVGLFEGRSLGHQRCLHASRRVRDLGHKHHSEYREAVVIGRR